MNNLSTEEKADSDKTVTEKEILLSLKNLNNEQTPCTDGLSYIWNLYSIAC